MIVLTTTLVTTSRGNWVEVREKGGGYWRVSWNISEPPIKNHFKGVKHYLRKKHGIRVPEWIKPNVFHYMNGSSQKVTWYLKEDQIKAYFYKEYEEGYNDTNQTDIERMGSEGD